MEALLTFFWRFALELWPWTTIDAWELAVRVRMGKWLRDLKPGLRVSLPFLDHIITEPATLQTINLTDQTITTSDGTNVSIGGVIRYHVVDLKLLWMQVNDYEEALSNSALTALAAQIAAREYSECVLKAIERNTKARLRRSAKPWGIHIDGFELTDLCESQVIRLMSPGSQSIVLAGVESE